MVNNNEKLIHWFNEFKQGKKIRKVNSIEVKELNKKFKVSSNYLTALVRSGIITRIKRGEYQIEHDLDLKNIKKVKKEMTKIVINCKNNKAKKQKVSVCKYCSENFIQHHKLQIYCPSKFGIKNYCKYNNKNFIKSIKPIKLSFLQKIKNWFKSIF